MSTRRSLLLLAPLAFAIALAAGHARAEDVRVFAAGETVDPADVARILDPSSAPATPAAYGGLKMRSLKLLDELAAGPTGTAPTSVPAASGDDLTPVAYTTSAPRQAPSALALPVQFEFDSATILASATRQLDALAEGIRRLPASKMVRIEGHTDATGAPRYNEQLSQRRAEAVKTYLVAVQHIAPERLHAVGLGQVGLLQGLDPHSAENRRVQFGGE